MPLPDELLARAQAWATAHDLPYAGALTPADAWQFWQQHPDTKLVDVRTRAEWDWVGRVPGAIEIEWNQYPGGIRNPDFLLQLRSHAQASDTLLFLCRSGVRSDGAARAATEAGYRCCINILEGFEGDKDAAGHRGQTGGWKVAGLPWLQG